MRTSRVSKDTAHVLQAHAQSPSRRTTRSSTSLKANPQLLAGFAYRDPVEKKSRGADSDSSPSFVTTVDLEDISFDVGPAVKRQKTADSSGNGTRSRKTPARRIGAAGKSKTPPNWEVMYNTVKKMREENPSAPVDTVGCAELYWRGTSARNRRFHTLTALMLSSQTKDTTTAMAMHRLHTELGDTAKSPGDSTLTLENMLSVSPERLNELIHVVGFHNNKTKYIKATALILRDQFDSDIPSTAEELMELPGVGPKMAYLCMSACWDKHDGIGVDVHVHRITNLWGWNKTKTPEETRVALQSWLPRDKWHEINKLLVGFGQTVCLPVGRRCGECALAGKGLCRSEVKSKGGG